jgi:signal transduction histidine kinase
MTFFWLVALIFLSLNELKKNKFNSYLVLYFFGNALWSLTVAIIPHISNLQVAIEINRIKFIGIQLIIISIIKIFHELFQDFHLNFSSFTKKIIHKGYTFCFIFPIFFIFISLYQFHPLIFCDYDFLKIDFFNFLTFQNGLFFPYHHTFVRIFFGVNIALLIVGSFFLTPHQKILNSSQRLTLGLLLTLPFAVDIFSVIYLPILRWMQITPIFLTITSSWFFFQFILNKSNLLINQALHKYINEQKDYFFVLDLKGRCVFANNGGMKILNMNSIPSRKQKIHTVLKTYFFPLNNQSLTLLKNYKNTQDSLSQQQLPFEAPFSWGEYLREDSSGQLFHFSYQVIHHLSQDTVGYLYHFRNITQISEILNHLFYLNENLNVMLSTVGHDLMAYLSTTQLVAKESIAIIQSELKDFPLQLQILEEISFLDPDQKSHIQQLKKILQKFKNSTEDIHTYMSEIQSYGASQSQYIDELLTWTKNFQYQKNNLGKSQNQPDLCLKTIIEDVLDLQRYFASEKDIEIHYINEHSHLIHNPLIHPIVLKVILNNLLGNAIKHSLPSQNVYIYSQEKTNSEINSHSFVVSIKNQGTIFQWRQIQKYLKNSSSLDLDNFKFNSCDLKDFNPLGLKICIYCCEMLNIQLTCRFQDEENWIIFYLSIPS